MPRIHFQIASVLASLALFPAVSQAEEFIYPDPGALGVIDVTLPPWNLDNSGQADVTATLQTLVDQTIISKFGGRTGDYTILYFPNGVYRMTDSIVGAILDAGEGKGGMIFQGQSRDGVILQLDDASPGFDDPLQPKPFIDYFAGGGTNNAFINMLENVTVDVGSGNSGAIGVRFHGNNTAAVRNVRIVTSDPAGAGFAGLEAIKNTNGPWMVKGLEIEGFDYALNLGNTNSARHMVAIQDLHISGQGVAGIQLEDFILNIIDGTSVNNVPFLIEESRIAMVNLLNCDIRTTEAVAAAAITAHSYVFLRDSTISGYDCVVENQDGCLLESLAIDQEWFSHDGLSLWNEGPLAALGLPVERAPEFPWFDPVDWAVVGPGNGTDDTETIRAALESGKPMVIFPKGTYNISQSLRVPPHVERISCQWAFFRLEGILEDGVTPVFEVDSSHDKPLLIEKVRSQFSQPQPNPLILNGGSSTLVLRDIFYVAGAAYRSEPTRGKVFLENFHTLPGTQENKLSIPAYVIRGQDVWAMQWNPEQLFPHAIVDGGRFWAFGWKTGETRGPIVDVRNHGYAELFGGSMNCTHDSIDIDPVDTILLQSTDANLSASFIEHAQLTGGSRGWGRHATVAVETRGDDIRTLPTTDPSVIHATAYPPQYGAIVPLFAGYFPQQDPTNLPPEISGITATPDSTGYNYTLTAELSDPDGFPAPSPKLHVRTLAGTGMARVVDLNETSKFIQFEKGGQYELEVSATDGALETSQFLTIPVRPREFLQQLTLRDAYRFVDNAPLDGIADLMGFGFLYLGDDAVNKHTSLRFELDLNTLEGSTETLKQADLVLYTQSVSGQMDENIKVSYAAEQSFGISNLEDFTVPRTQIGELNPDELQPGEFFTVDLLEAVLRALQNDERFLTVWLEAGYSENSSADSVIISAPVASIESQRPVFRALFTGPTLAESSKETGSAFSYHPVFGFWTGYGDWIYQFPLGWLYTNPDVSTVDAFHAWSPEYGWILLSDRFYPWFYAYQQPAWMNAF